MRFVPHSKTVLDHLPKVSGLFLVALGMVVLIGWAGDIFWLKGVLPGQETMKVNTAIAFILLGGALFSLSQRKEWPAPFPWEDVVLGTVGLLALGTLAQYFLGIRLGLDELIFRDGDALSPYPGRMAPNTAVAVLAASGGLWMARRAAGRETMAAGALLVALFLVLMALLAGLGYAANLTSGYRWGAVTAMAMHTAVGFFVLGVGILGFLEGRKYVRWHLRAPLTAVLLGGVLLLVVVALHGWETMLRWRTSSQQVVRTMESRHLLADLSGRISDLEREKRGSRLDGEDTQRVGMNGSHEAISATLLALRKTFAISGSSGDLERLSAYVDEKAALDFEIMERWANDPGLSDVHTMVASRSLMTEITSILAALDEQLRDSGEGARTEVRAQERLALVVLPAGSLASLFLIGWALALFNAEAGVRQQGETRFRGIFDSTFQFIGLLRPDGVVVEANQTALAFAECRKEDVVGKYFPDTPWWRFQSVEGRDRLIAALRRAALGEAVRFEFEVAGAEGKRAVIDFSLKPVLDHLGAVVFLVPEGHDITALKEAQQRLFEAEQRWDAALSGSELGVWDWNPINQKAYYSPHYCSMLGYSPKEFGNSGEDWSKRVHPDDLSATLAAIRDHLEGRTPVYSADFRMRARDGGWRWILDRGKVMQRDAAGRAIRVVGTHTDITPRREAEERIGVLQRQLEGILRFSPNFITLVDNDCRYLLVGDRVAESMGRPVEEMVGHVFEEVFDAELAALFRSYIERMQRDPQPFSVEDVVPIAGEERIFETQLFPLMDGSGEHYATGGIARDVTEMRGHDH